MAHNEFQRRMIVGLRNDWEFEYTAGNLADAAEKQKAHRLERKQAWIDQYRDIQAKIKDGGVTIHESVSKHMGNTTSYGHDPEVQIDPKLSKDLKEAHRRIQTHDDAAREYDGWIQVLRANKEDRLKLNHGDWLYFFGGLEEDEQ